MTEQTRAKWAERIREWRDSGLSAEDFTAGKGYEGSSLRWAASQLGTEKAKRPTTARAPRGRRVAERPVPPPPRVPRFVPVRMRQAEPVGAEMIVEVGGARIRVTRGVDVGLLGDVVRALQGGGR